MWSARAPCISFVLDTHTEAGRIHIFFFRALTRRKFVIQTELAIAVVAAERSVILFALDVFIRVFELRAREGALVEVEDVVHSARGFGFAWIEGNNRAIGETSAFAEGSWCYLDIGLAMRVV